MTHGTEKCDNSEDLQQLYEKSRDYLYPFFFEFMLTAAALLAELWLEHEDTRRDEDGEPTPDPGTRKVSASGSVIFGLLFVGNMIVMLMVCHFFESGEDANRILNIQSVVVAVVAILVTLWATFLFVDTSPIARAPVSMKLCCFCRYLVTFAGGFLASWLPSTPWVADNFVECTRRLVC